MTFTCCKCSKTQDDAERAAWDGKGNEACWACFARHGWARSFPEPVLPPAPWMPNNKEGN